MNRRAASDRETFGREVLGPLLALFCRDLLLVMEALPRRADSVALFMARGGWRLRDLTERFARRTGLRPAIPLAWFLGSRLALARAAYRRSPHAPEELERCLARLTMDEALTALLERPVAVEAGWRPFRRAALEALMAGDSAAGRAAAEALAEQEGLLLRHLDETMGEARHGIVIDTGSYGSAVRLLAGFDPARSFGCAMLLRQNHRAVAAPHFAVTAGLLHEDAAPASPMAEISRHWHLIEHALEPNIPSVRRYRPDPDSGRVSADAEIPDWRARVARGDDPLHAGIVRYFEDGLSPSSVGGLDAAAAAAAVRLSRIFTRPTAADVAALGVGFRAESFAAGLGEAPLVAPGPRLSDRIGSLGRARWREGQIRLAFPLAASLALPALVMARRATRAVR
jgi:hypothetical protein